MPVNVIFTGVAGTGKTYQLQQIAQAYTEHLPIVSREDLLTNLVAPLSWRDVLCLVLLAQRQQGKNLIKVPEILSHPFFEAKANLNRRDENLSQTAWGTLMMYSDINSVRVKYHRRASQAFFDKDESSNWFLLEDSLPLLQELQAQLEDYQAALAHPLQPKTERFSLVSFHQAYGYEEFVEGIRPTTVNGQVTYRVEPGAFLLLCERARQDPSHRYAMLIDELNRANVARVFGELMSLIEPTKRLGQAHALQLTLAYSKQPFGIPSNVDIFATMNPQDQSLAPLDMAFRRRFRFIDCPPQPALLPTLEIDGQALDLARLLVALNQRVLEQLGQDSQLGHSFLMGVDDVASLAEAFAQSIIPQLAQASGSNGTLLQAILGGHIIEAVASAPAGGFGGYARPSGYRVKLTALQQVATYVALYQSASAPLPHIQVMNEAAADGQQVGAQPTSDLG